MECSSVFIESVKFIAEFGNACQIVEVCKSCKCCVYMEHAWEMGMAEVYGRCVWLKCMGDGYGRCVWEMGMAEVYGRWV